MEDQEVKQAATVTIRRAWYSFLLSASSVLFVTTALSLSFALVFKESWADAKGERNSCLTNTDSILRNALNLEGQNKVLVAICQPYQDIYKWGQSITTMADGFNEAANQIKAYCSDCLTRDQSKSLVQKQAELNAQMEALAKAEANKLLGVKK